MAIRWSYRFAPPSEGRSVLAFVAASFVLCSFVLCSFVFTSPVCGQAESSRRQTRLPPASEHEAQEAQEMVTQRQIDQLIAQLGSDDYVSRDLAARSLRKIGGDAVEALESVLLPGVETVDSEIRMRAERLLLQIQRDDFQEKLRQFLVAENESEMERIGLFGWPNFSRIAGDTKASRRMFVGMYKNQYRFFRAIGNGKEASEKVFRAHASSSLRITTTAGRLMDTLGCLIFVSSYPFEDPTQPTSGKTIDVKQGTFHLIVSRLNRAENVTYAKSCNHREALERLIDYWLRTWKQDNLSAVEMRLLIIENYELDLQLDYLENLVNRKDLAIRSRVRAMESLASLGSQELLNSLAHLLEEKTLVDQFPHPELKGQILESQFCDIALAACIHLAGANPTEFGFQFDDATGDGAARLKSDPNSKPFVRTRCGFANESLRKEAIRRWRAALKDLAN